MTFIEKVKKVLNWTARIVVLLFVAYFLVKYFGKSSVDMATSMFKDTSINSNIKIDERREVCVTTRKCHDVVVLKYFDHIVFMGDNGDMLLIK